MLKPFFEEEEEEDYSSLFQQQQYTWRGFSKVEEEKNKRTF